MVTRIAFPTPGSVDIRTFPDMGTADRSLREIASGTVFILAELTPASIRVLTLAQMVAIYNAGSGSAVKTLPSKKDAATRILDIIPGLAKEADIMATKAKAKKTAAPRAKATATATVAPGTSGRTSSLIGQKITKTGKRAESQAHKNSRRSQSYALLKNGMKYETALAAGAHKDDIAKLIFTEHITLA